MLACIVVYGYLNVHVQNMTYMHTHIIYIEKRIIFLRQLSVSESSLLPVASAAPWGKTGWTDDKSSISYMYMRHTELTTVLNKLHVYINFRFHLPPGEMKSWM